MQFRILAAIEEQAMRGGAAVDRCYHDGAAVRKGDARSVGRDCRRIARTE